MPKLALQHPEEDRSRPPPRACQGPVNPSINSSNPSWSRRVPGSVPLMNEAGPPRFPDPCSTQRPNPAWRQVSPAGWVAETPGRVRIGWWCPRGGGDQAQRRGQGGGRGGGGGRGCGCENAPPGAATLWGPHFCRSGGLGWGPTGRPECHSAHPS